MATENTESEIKVPAARDLPEGQEANLDEMFAFQDAKFNQKGSESSEESKKIVPKKMPKDPAQDIFNKTQSLNKKDKTEDDSSFEVPETVDIIASLQGKKDNPALSEAPKTSEEDFEDEGEPGESGEPELETLESLESKSSSKEDNIKNLRQLVNAAKKEKEDLQKRLQDLESQLQSSPTTVAMETENAKLRARVAQLEPYEMVFGLHNNPHFKSKFIDGSNSLLEETKTIIKDYGLDDSLVEDIFATQNRRELDELLGSYFSSTTTIQDIKQLKQKFDSLQKERSEFEKKPKESLEKFEQEKALTEAEKSKKRDALFKEVTHRGWQRALASNLDKKEEQKIYELIEIPGKKDHNEKVVRPTLSAANNMASAGLSHIEKMIRSQSVLDESFVSWFADVCQQAAATQMVHSTRLGLLDVLKKTQKETQKQQKIDRPGINPQPKSKSASSTSGKGKTGKEIAAEIWMETMDR